ncbi:MAG: DUF4037 domain-containing protein [Clostridiales bacterium]|nr:DUF4037 domain-containing protein [Clostridiales bacterium]
MRGLELSKKYFEEYGLPMLNKDFQDLMPMIAVGLVGEGSECFGYDDEVSQDHDFEPGFCIFVPDDIDSRREFALERAYAKLPGEFLGHKRQKLSPIGGNRHGVIKTCDFYKKFTGSSSGPETVYDWFSIPEFYLAEATNGEVFMDNYGEFSKIRESLKYYPDDVRIKKIAGNVLVMGQAGQYNYKRCLDHDQRGSAQIAVSKFVEAAMNVIFLLNKEYMPYYKWSFKAMSELQIMNGCKENLEYLISSSNEDGEIENKLDIIESICSDVADELRLQKLSDAVCTDMEKNAYSVNDHVKDNNLRNENVLFAI